MGNREGTVSIHTEAPSLSAEKMSYRPGSRDTATLSFESPPNAAFMPLQCLTNISIHCYSIERTFAWILFHVATYQFEFFNFFNRVFVSNGRENFLDSTNLNLIAAQFHL